MYKKLYKKLDKDLKGIRRKRNIKNYNRWSESRSCIDEFYSKNTISLDNLYNRLTYLKRKSEEFKVIKLPAYMSIVLGAFVTMGINAMLSLLDYWDEFLMKSKEILEKVLEKIPFDYTQQITEVYNEAIIETLLKYVLIFGLFVICLLVLLFLLVRIPKLWVRCDNSKLVVREYEINKVQLLLDALEEKGLVKTNTILKLENRDHLLEYTLTKVTKK